MTDYGLNQRTTCNVPELRLVVSDKEGDVGNRRKFVVGPLIRRLGEDLAIRVREDEVEARNA